MNKSFYEKTSPENANINSKRIINFINRLEKEEVDYAQHIDNEGK